MLAGAAVSRTCRGLEDLLPGQLTHVPCKFVLAAGSRPRLVPPHEALSGGLLECSLDTAAGLPDSKWIKNWGCRTELQEFYNPASEVPHCRSHHSLLVTQVSPSQWEGGLQNIRGWESLWAIGRLAATHGHILLVWGWEGPGWVSRSSDCGGEWTGVWNPQQNSGLNPWGRKWRHQNHRGICTWTWTPRVFIKVEKETVKGTLRTPALRGCGGR